MSIINCTPLLTETEHSPPGIISANITVCVQSYLFLLASSKITSEMGLKNVFTLPPEVDLTSTLRTFPSLIGKTDVIKPQRPVVPWELNLLQQHNISRLQISVNLMPLATRLECTDVFFLHRLQNSSANACTRIHWHFKRSFSV